MPPPSWLATRTRRDLGLDDPAWDALGSVTPDYDDALAAEEVWTLALQVLSPPERHLLAMIRQGCTQVQIGEALGCTRAWITQLTARLTVRLQQALAVRATP